MESPGSSIRSAARATFSAYRAIPVRWRLAGGSAALTFVILAAFATLVGVLTTKQVRGTFNTDVQNTAQALAHQLKLHWQPNGELDCANTNISLSDFVSAEHAQIRIYTDDGTPLCTQDQVLNRHPKKPPQLEPPLFPAPFEPVVTQELGYRVVVPHQLRVAGPGSEHRVWLLYARPLSDLDHTIARVQFFLLLGVLGGTVLALLAGLATAQRAIRPIVELTEAAREIERTRDPSRHVPLPRADDEVAELARTLEGMLQSLDEARTGTETMLARQREFVADASHELRTPLTSVLASLELLSEELEGEQADTAQAALRSARRMRRLVGDLLLLARADARRMQPHRPTELSDVLMEAASEIGPVADEHELAVDARPARVSGARDELHRMVLNLLENAVRHTPPGTRVRASTSSSDGHAVVVVEDTGPGIPPELADRVFERFVRGGGEGALGSGLGLAIVQAVAESHGGTVTLTHGDGGSGTCFVVRLPAAKDDVLPPAEPEPQAGADRAGDYTSTTTGSTIGRRRRRS
ncbi:MAG: sensor histidine kinase [Solirubrobacteraceae bacterium]